MPFYYFVYIVVVLGLITFFIRYLFSRRTSLSRELYMKGIKAENSGNYEEASSSYQKALSEVKNSWFHRKLENQIHEKVKILENVATYKRDQNFIRVDNSWIS